MYVYFEFGLLLLLMRFGAKKDFQPFYTEIKITAFIINTSVQDSKDDFSSTLEKTMFTSTKVNEFIYTYTKSEFGKIFKCVNSQTVFLFPSTFFLTHNDRKTN